MFFLLFLYLKDYFKLIKIKIIYRLAADLELNCFTFGTFGKEFIKSQKLSPDSFIQMAMQLAFYR